MQNMLVAVSINQIETAGNIIAVTAGKHAENAPIQKVVTMR